MQLARYYRRDLVSNEPTIEVGFSILPASDDVNDLHHWATIFGKYRDNAVAYRLFEGNNLRSMRAISLTHALD